jgi:DNA topoisomerase-2
MSVCSEPVIKKNKQVPDLHKGSGFTKVSWIPDFQRFDKMTKYDDDIISLYEKYIYDTAMIVSKYGVKVWLNDKLIPITSIRDYALLYRDPVDSDSDDEAESSEKQEEEIQLFSSEDSKIVLLPFDNHLSVSFVNGICTTEGGVHNDAWCEAIFRPIVDKINGTKKDDASASKTQAEKEKEKKKREKQKKETNKIDIGDVKDKFAIFIDCELSNPEFRGQNKTKLASPSVQVNVKKTDISKIMKWSVIDDIKHMLEIKELSELKVKKKGFTKVEGLDDANFAKKATKRSECILTITEGLSAKTYVVQGMKVGLVSRSGAIVSGRDYIGVLPIRGKFINPRGRSMKAVASNKEVKAFVQALGLQVGLDYTNEENLKTLRYGKLVIFADADKDGIHIIGLLYNFLHTIYPTILKVPGFFCFARTPIMKINNKLVFYYLDQARKYIEENKVGKNSVKYYKGLGTSNQKDVQTDFGKRITQLIYNVNTDTTIDNIFNKKKSWYRKEWLTSFDPESILVNEVQDNQLETLDTDKFINEEFITFSIEDCKRSLPTIFDGLKESQRKILYAVFKRNLKYSGNSLKVAQLSGYVAEHTNYHHGEDNLLETIRGMAQRYVGSNNMPYFFNDGQFGSRLENGKDGASGRYIFTKMEKYTRDLFPEQDDAYLENVEDDGDIVEKKYYIPVIPTVLVNGCIGIGTGFSTSIPSFNPTTLIEWIRVWIERNGIVKEKNDDIEFSYTPELIPWYRNFKGEIKVVDHKVYTYGVIQDLSKGKYRVTELPVGKKNWSIEKFKSHLEELLEKKRIKDFEDHTDDNTVNFIIIEDPDGMKLSLENLGLVDTIHTSNMVMFTSENKIKKYSTVEEILVDFCDARLKLYETRRKGEIQKLEEELLYINNKIRFINEINLPDIDSNKLVIKNKEDEELYSEMTARGYSRKSNTEDGDTKIGCFNYLLNIKIRGATKKKMDELVGEKEKVETALYSLKLKRPQDLWIDDLDKLHQSYNEWLLITGEKESSEINSKPKPTKKTINKK